MLLVMLHSPIFTLRRLTLCSYFLSISRLKLTSVYCDCRSSDKTVIFWDLDSGNKLTPLCSHDSDVVAICSSEAAGAAAGRSQKDGGVVPLVISASWDGMLRAWAPETGDCLRVVRVHPQASEALPRFGPSVASLSVAGSGIVGGFVGGLVRIFDVWTGLAPSCELRWPGCGCVQVCIPPSKSPIWHLLIFQW